MSNDGESRAGATLDRSWLERVDGPSPLLLVAPHGGRAGPDARHPVNPKVNDLHTAAITREFAARTGASALINCALDRNHVDLNRMTQLLARAPWFLELVAERVGAIVSRHGRAVVLLIHGWNVIAPRLDVGIGARRHGGELRPAGSARLSASDDFINGPLARLGKRLAQWDIAATFGLRYPAGGAQNLLQAFTDRHLESEVPALRQLSAIAARGTLEAAQLELSVALRLPGQPRERCVEAMVDVFGDSPRAKSAAAPPSRLRIIRTPEARTALPARRPPASAPPGRVGIECFDARAGVGAMASFDLGPSGLGARIMLLLPGGRVALFTNEGRTALEGAGASLGPLHFEAHGGRLRLRFRGPMVTVPDATSYRGLARALASGRLDESAEVDLELEPYPDESDPRAFFRENAGEWDPVATSAFGTLAGEIRAGGLNSALGGFGRAGSSFAGLGPLRFRSRRMMWACFGTGAEPRALEIRIHNDDDGSEHASARILNGAGWSACETALVELETHSLSAPPTGLRATFAEDGVPARTVVGEIENFVPLSRPGPANTRIFTSLGFARFSLGAEEGGGLFEYSRRADPGAADESPDSDDD